MVGAGVCVIRPGIVAEGVKVGVAVRVLPGAGVSSVLVAPGSGVAEGVNPGNKVAVGSNGSLVEVGRGVRLLGGNGVPCGVPVLDSDVGSSVDPGSDDLVASGVMLTEGLVPIGT